MKVQRNKPQGLQRLFIWTAYIIVFTTVILSLYFFITRDKNPLPANISRELTFSPLVISGDANNYPVTDYKFNIAEDKVQILSYIIRMKDNSITVSEYTQPPEFTDIPEYKDRFLSNVIKQYAMVQTSNGTVYLGRMTKNNNKQLGIMIEKGLIMFLSPEKEIEQNQWRNIGDQLEIKKISN